MTINNDSSYRFDFYAAPPGPKWLRDILGDDILAHAVNVHFNNSPVIDADLIHVSQLSHLEFLGLIGTQVSDVGLQQLHGLSRLKQVELYRTAVTEEGCERLQRAIPNLEIRR